MPELTPYGRMFKLNGYTFGERTIPVAVMAMLDVTQDEAQP
ncbi:D-aminopeptidase [Paraburkholderia sp. UCT70]